MQHPVDQIELRAYQFWEERGRPWGTPEEDWFKAEQELNAKPEGILAKLALEVGSGIGSAVALLKGQRPHHNHGTQE